MSNNFSDIDSRLLKYLKNKGRFTSSDSIMAGREQFPRSKADLGDSWIDADDEEVVSDDYSGKSLDLSDPEYEPQAPLTSVKEEGGAILERSDNLGVSDAQRRRSDRIARQSVEPENKAPATPQSANRRSTPRTGSRQDSMEHSFIMPSMYSSGSLRDPSPRRSPLTTSIRARRPQGLASSRVLLNSNGKRSPKPVSSPRQTKKPRPQEGSSSVALLWNNVIGPTIWYALGVLGHASVWLKPFFGFALALFLLFLGFKAVFQTSISALNILPGITNFVPPMPSPCSIPGMSWLPVCGSSYPQGGHPEFEQLVTVQSSFEDILQSTAQGSILPVEMKRSEASIRDLKYVVTYSSLPSKGELVFEFQGFIDGARQAAADLTKFNSRIGRAVDHIISTNKHTLQVIDGFVDTESSRGALSRWIFGSGALSDEHLLHQYLQHTSQVEEQIQRLILEAQVLLKVLEDLDSHLDVIHGVVTRDGVHVKDSRDELFASLWTKLGGNRSSVQKLDDQIRLLKSVNTYRKAAWSHVTATLLKLQAISAGLEDLRERVALPETVGVNAVPLSQHIETISLGVERLERVRESARGLEMDGQRRILNGEEMAGKERLVEGGNVKVNVVY